MGLRQWSLEAEANKRVSSRAIGIKQIPGMRLSESVSRDIALKVYSEILDSEIWFFGNAGISSRIKEDYPEAATYTADELRKLYKLNPSPDDLRAVSNIKTVFDGSKIVGSRLKRRELCNTKPDKDGKRRLFTTGGF